MLATAARPEQCSEGFLNVSSHLFAASGSGTAELAIFMARLE